MYRKCFLFLFSILIPPSSLGKRHRSEHFDQLFGTYLNSTVASYGSYGIDLNLSWHKDSIETVVVVRVIDCQRLSHSY